VVQRKLRVKLTRKVDMISHSLVVLNREVVNVDSWIFISSRYNLKMYRIFHFSSKLHEDLEALNVNGMSQENAIENKRHIFGTNIELLRSHVWHPVCVNHYKRCSV
jgi:hypothetical protein